MGLGTFGQQIAKTLFQNGVKILAIDREQAKVDRVAPWVDKAICAEVNNTSVLKAHGVFDFEVVIIALRKYFDSTVLLTNALSKEGVKHIIVQVDSEAEAEVVQLIGATSVVLPQRDMAIRIAQRLLSPSLSDFLPLGPNVSIIEEPLPKALHGKSLLEMDFRKTYGVTVLALKHESRKDSPLDVNPDPKKPLSKGSVLVLMGENQKLDEMVSAFSLF